MKIRRATVQDAPILAALIQDVQRLHANALPDFFKQPEQITSFVEDFRQWMQGSDTTIFIAEVDNTPAGYIYAEVVRRDETPFTYPRIMVYIEQISVKPVYQGKGCGRALVEAVFDLARAEGISQVGLDTWAFNTEAHKFFARMGFAFLSHRMTAHLAVNKTETV